MSDRLTIMLTHAVETLRSTRFTASLVALLRELVEFDCAVILGHRPGRHPIYLFDSLSQQRELLFQRYLMQAWQGDPFLVALDRRRAEGVFRFADVLASPELDLDRVNKEYVENFYRQTGWRDELCLAVRIDDARWIVIYLGLIDERRSFSDDDCRRLHERFELLAALCRQHWASDPFTLARAASGEDDPEEILTRALATFGEALLTTRERQVAALMVQGLAPDEIAERLEITPGTVKNHRKRLYARIGIGSRGELFRLFLNHAVTLVAREGDIGNCPFEDIAPTETDR
ncbi:helix-turn-helix transcriptional regulator [Halomonas ramblicola]|uniref:helix-turn-helix transcriptional regulator n=1 Tax=Halomonas ramblicola TaxID=747349 RepID=UPI0025B3705C|nr:LuxR C-terminal-related transcriptional regulator [Halomonas ramblicola]MDN3522921.1 LuxR C-terminal-related transcriptional regulator [Halomonas ramblicola]